MIKEERVECRSKNTIKDSGLTNEYILKKAELPNRNSTYGSTVNDLTKELSIQIMDDCEKQIINLLKNHGIKTNKPRYIKMWMTRKKLRLTSTFKSSANIIHKIGTEVYLETPITYNIEKMEDKNETQ